MVLRAAARVLTVCVILGVLLTTLGDRGPWTRWVMPTILVVVGTAFFTWLRERRHKNGA